MAAVRHELDRATKHYGKFNSPHEGYAVLLEEVEELWAEVMKKPGKRSQIEMFDEAKQIAAMAMRFMLDCC